MHKNNEYVLHPSSSTAVLSLWYVLGYFSEHVSFHLFSEVVPVIFFLKTSNLEAFQIKINSADDRLRSRNLYLHTQTGKTEGMFMKSTAR